jgi:ABC-2 type transport system permease protein
LLATPITTLELLAGKVLGALIPALGLSAATYIFYIVIAALFAEPGVYRVLLTPRSLAVVFGLGPLASLAALQLAVCVSSRVNDARSAQQIGALVILPIGALLVAQVVGTLVLSIPVVLAIAAGLLALNVVVMAIAVALFDRESILTRWR